MELIVGRTDGHLQIYGAYGETASELWRSGAVPSSPTELKEATGKLTSENLFKFACLPSYFGVLRCCLGEH